MGTNLAKALVRKAGVATCAFWLVSGVAMADSDGHADRGADLNDAARRPDRADVGLHLRHRRRAAPAAPRPTARRRRPTTWQPPLITVPQGQPLNITLVNTS